MDFLLNCKLNLTANEISHALQHATSVSLYDGFRVQLALNETKEDNFDFLQFPIYAHPISDLNQHGVEPKRRFPSSDPRGTVFETLASFTTKFLELLFASKHPSAAAIAKTLTSVLKSNHPHQVNPWKKNFY